MGDPVTSSLYLDQFEFKFILKEDIDGVLNFLRTSLWPVFGIYGYDEQTMVQDWRTLFKGMLERSYLGAGNKDGGTSFMVVDTKTNKVSRNEWMLILLLITKNVNCLG